MPTLEEITKGVRDSLTVDRVFGTPIETNGTTIIPVASVSGGGGGGQGPGQAAEGEEVTGADKGEAAEAAGGGFGVNAKAMGIYVVHGETVEWRPAVDVTRIAVAGIVLAGLIAVLTAGVFRRAMR